MQLLRLPNGSKLLGLLMLLLPTINLSADRSGTGSPVAPEPVFCWCQLGRSGTGFPVSQKRLWQQEWARPWCGVPPPRKHKTLEVQGSLLLHHLHSLNAQRLLAHSLAISCKIFSIVSVLHWSRKVILPCSTWYKGMKE